MGGLISRDRFCGYGVSRRLALLHLMAQLRANHLKPQILTKVKLGAECYTEMSNTFFRITNITGRWRLDNPSCVKHDVIILVGRVYHNVTCYQFEDTEHWLCVGDFNGVKCKGQGLTLMQSIYNMFIDICITPGIFAQVTDRRSHIRAIVNAYGDPYIDIARDISILLSVRLKKGEPRRHYTIRFETQPWPNIPKTELMCHTAVLVDVDYYIHEV